MITRNRSRNWTAPSVLPWACSLLNLRSLTHSLRQQFRCIHRQRKLPRTHGHVLCTRTNWSPGGLAPSPTPSTGAAYASADVCACVHVFTSPSLDPRSPLFPNARMCAPTRTNGGTVCTNAHVQAGQQGHWCGERSISRCGRARHHALLRCCYCRCTVVLLLGLIWLPLVNAKANTLGSRQSLCQKRLHVGENVV